MYFSVLLFSGHMFNPLSPGKDAFSVCTFQKWTLLLGLDHCLSPPFYAYYFFPKIQMNILSAQYF